MFGKQKSKLKKIFFCVIIITLFLNLNFSTFASPSSEITYHGKLTDLSDVPVADGNYDFVFKIFDASSGGTCVWVSRGTCGSPTTKSIAVSKGVFYTILGESGDNALTLDFNSDYWFEIKVGTNSPMTPRRKITANNYSINSGKLNGQSSSYYLDTSATEQTKSGNLNLSSNLALTGAYKDKDGDAGTSGQILSSTGTATNWVNVSAGSSILDADSDTKVQTEESADEDKIRFDTAGSERMIIDNAGNVGIGQSSPTARIHIKGSTSNDSAYNLKLDNSSDTNLLQVRNDGAIMLPLTTNTNKPVGVIYKDGNRFFHDFNYGNNGSVTTIGKNIFIGEDAGNFTMGATATSASESSENVGIGANVLKSNTIGSKNVGVGDYSLSSNTTGANITAIGYGAMRYSTRGFDNTGIGYSSLNYNSGSYNSVVGSYSLGSNSGNFNSAIGYGVMESNTSGISNTALGSYSLAGNTTGSYNVAVGAFSGRYITGGVNSNQTSTYSVYLGNNTKSSANGNTNEIVIGYDTTGKGSNTVNLGNDSITATYINGQLNLDNYKFPTADGTSGQVLKTDGSGTLTWQDVGASGYLSRDAVNGYLYPTTLTDDLGLGINAPTARTHIEGETSDDTTYALKVEDSSNSNLLSVRNDGLIETEHTTFPSTESGSNDFVFNKNGLDIDFFVKGQGSTNSFFVDVSKSAVVIGDTTATTGYRLDVRGNTLLKGLSSDDTSYGIKLNDSSSVKLFYVRNDGRVEFKNYLFPTADGTSGQVLKTDGAGNLSFADISSLLAYGEMYQNDNVTATTINTIDVWEEINNFSAGELSGVTFASSDLTVTEAGKYHLNVSVSGIPQTANDVFEFAISVNDTIITKTKAHRKFSSATDAGSVSLNGILNLSASDVVKLEVRNTTGADDFTVENCNLTLNKI